MGGERKQLSSASRTCQAESSLDLTSTCTGLVSRLSFLVSLFSLSSSVACLVRGVSLLAAGAGGMCEVMMVVVMGGRAGSSSSGD